jgi:hypothetical protein
MTTFIPYQPRESASPFSRNTIGIFASVGPPDSVLSRQSWQHADWVKVGIRKPHEWLKLFYFNLAGRRLNVSLPVIPQPEPAPGSQNQNHD